MFRFKTKRYYLDYAAATPVSSEVTSAMQAYWSIDFANPSSIHQSGRTVKKVIENCEKKVRLISNMKHNDQIIWTSGGTESNHLAIDTAIGYWKQTNPEKKYTIVMSSAEHSSVMGYIESINDPLMNVYEIPVDENGKIRLEILKSRLDSIEDIILVSCLLQSSEIGTTQPLHNIGEVIREARGGKDFPLFHVDASQGLYYHQLNVQSWHADLLTVCGQKIGGPKGSGILLVESELSVHREGTIAVPLVVGLVKTLELAQKDVVKKRNKIVTLRLFFFQTMRHLKVEYVCNGREDEASLVINVSFTTDNRDSEQLIVAFDQAGLEVSSKSACMGLQSADSHLLNAMSLHPKNSIRICLEHHMHEKDIREIVVRISRLVE